MWAFNSLDDLEAGPRAAFQRRFGVSDLQEPGTAAFNVFQAGLYAAGQLDALRGPEHHPGRARGRAVPVAGRTPTSAWSTTRRSPSTPARCPAATPSGRRAWASTGTWTAATRSLRGGIGIFSGRPPYVWVSNAYSINGLSQVEVTCNAQRLGRRRAGVHHRPERPAVRLRRRHHAAHRAGQPG